MRCLCLLSVSPSGSLGPLLGLGGEGSWVGEKDWFLSLTTGKSDTDRPIPPAHRGTARQPAFLSFGRLHWIAEPRQESASIPGSPHVRRQARDEDRRRGGRSASGSSASSVELPGDELAEDDVDLLGLRQDSVAEYGGSRRKPGAAAAGRGCGRPLARSRQAATSRRAARSKPRCARSFFIPILEGRNAPASASVEADSQQACRPSSASAQSPPRRQPVPCRRRDRRSGRGRPSTRPWNRAPGTARRLPGASSRRSPT